MKRPGWNFKKGVYGPPVLLFPFFSRLSLSLSSRHRVGVRAQATAAANVTLELDVQCLQIPLIITNKYGKTSQYHFIGKTLKLFLIHMAIRASFTCTQWPGVWPLSSQGLILVKLFTWTPDIVHLTAAALNKPVSRLFLSSLMLFSSCQEFRVCRLKDELLISLRAWK